MKQIILYIIFLLIFIFALLLGSELRAQVKLSQLTETTSLADASILGMQVDSATYKVWRKITALSLKARMLEHVYPILHFNSSYELLSTGLGDTSVTNASIKAAAVTGDKISTLTITASNMAANSITTSKILDGEVLEADLAANSVSTGKIINDAVTTGKILNGTILAEDIAAGAVTTEKILDGEVSISDLDPAVIAYVGSAGTVTNAADDVTLEQIFLPDTAIAIKRNQPKQINFLANAKFGSDSSVYLGKDSLTFKKNSGTAVKNFIKISPYNLAGTAPMSIFVGEYDFGGSVMDHVMGWGYNTPRYNYTEPRGNWMIEGNYFNSGNPVLETYFEIFDSTALLSGWRPLQIGYYRKTNYITTAILSHKFTFGNATGTNIIDFYPDSTVAGYGGANGYMVFQDSTALAFSINNYSFLFQNNSSGSAQELLRLNANNDLELLDGNDDLASHVVLHGALTSMYGYSLDTGMVNIGNNTKAVTGLSFANSGNQGNLTFDGSTQTLVLNHAFSQSPYELYNNNMGNYGSNFALGGNIGLGTKSWESGNTNTLYLLNGTAPALALTNGVKLYSESGELKVMNSNGSITGLTGGTINFFNHDEHGGTRNFNPYLEDYLHSASSRFTVNDTGFSSITHARLFDGRYGLGGTIDATDTGKVYIDIDGKSEIDSIAYPEGYFLIHFYANDIPASVSGDIYYWDGWTAMTTVTDISVDGTHSLYKLTVPFSSKYARNFRIFVVAGGSSCTISEIEYYPLGAEETANISPLVNKFGANSLYNKLSFKNFNNTEKAYIDSNGNAYFQDLTVVNTITVSDSVVTQNYTTDTLTVNNISTLAAATATTLTVGTITSTNGRIQPATGGQIELDSLRNRVAKLDTLNYGFSIADAADGSYSAAIFTTMPITVTFVRTVLRTAVDGTQDTAKCNIYFSTDISSGSPNTLWSTDKNVVDSTTGTTYSSFDDATIPAYSWIWLQCNDEVGTVNQLNMTVFARKD